MRPATGSPAWEAWLGTLTEEELLVELAAVCPIAPLEKWQEIRTLPAFQQENIVAGWAAAQFTAPPDWVDPTLKVLGIIGTVAGVVTGLAGAETAIAALKSL